MCKKFRSWQSHTPSCRPQPCRTAQNNSRSKRVLTSSQRLGHLNLIIWVILIHKMWSVGQLENYWLTPWYPSQQCRGSQAAWGNVWQLTRCSWQSETASLRCSCDHRTSSWRHRLQFLASSRSSLPWRLQNPNRYDVIKWSLTRTLRRRNPNV